MEISEQHSINLKKRISRTKTTRVAKKKALQIFSRTLKSAQLFFLLFVSFHHNTHTHTHTQKHVTHTHTLTHKNMSHTQQNRSVHITANMYLFQHPHKLYVTTHKDLTKAKKTTLQATFLSKFQSIQCFFVCDFSLKNTKMYKN